MRLEELIFCSMRTRSRNIKKATHSEIINSVEGKICESRPPQLRLIVICCIYLLKTSTQYSDKNSEKNRKKSQNSYKLQCLE